MIVSVADGTLPADKLKAVLNPDYYQALSLAAKQSFIKGLKAVIWVNVSLLLIVTVLSFVLKNERPSTGS